jgi:hypothetical protein
MSTLFQKTFLQEPSSRSAAFPYGFLAIIFALFAFHVFYPDPHFWRGLIIPTMLLLNHLAFQFRWPNVLMIALRALALAWVIGGGILIFTV